MAEVVEEKKHPLEKAGFTLELEEEYNIISAGSPEPAAYIKTDYPIPGRMNRLVWESNNVSLEEPYYWVLNAIKQDGAFTHIFKITDTVTAGESSSMFGAQAQRLNIQQDKASQYMGTIASMVKNLFQIVREIRIIKERLEHYHGSKAGKKSADIALKGYWVDLVEGGGKSPSSVYGLASQLGFATLPDLFFNTMIRDGDDIGKAIEEQAGDFNSKVKEVLSRKLAQFVEWRKQTKAELETRHKFTLRYLRQHWTTIKMYMSWIKPMLKNIKRLQNTEKYRDSPEVLAGMESSMLEIEFLAHKNEINGHHPVIIAHFLYRTQAHMSFNNEYNRGPVHVGRITITLRSYGWTQDQIKTYQKYKEDEDLELLGMVDTSVEAAMEALGDELKKYLEEAEQDMGLSEKKDQVEDAIEKIQGPGFFEPFTALFSGVKDAVTLVVPGSEKKEKKISSGDNGPAVKAASAVVWATYKNFKKGHQMLAW